MVKKNKLDHVIFEDTIKHLISVLKDTKHCYFLRENDITCFLYKSLYNKFSKNKNYFVPYNGKKLFPIHTEHQYKSLNPTDYLGGEAIDLVLLTKRTNVKIALEVKSSFPNKTFKKKESKSSAGQVVLSKDVDKLIRLNVSWCYLLYYKEGGNCFLTSKNSNDRKKFFKHFKINTFWMYYIEKEDEKTSLPEFYRYTIDKKDYDIVELKRKCPEPKKHFNIIIYSNSKWTKSRILKNKIEI